MATKPKDTKGHADPMKTRTGKTRLGPLNLKQLEQLLASTSRPKETAKIENRMRIRDAVGV